MIKQNYKLINVLSFCIKIWSAAACLLILSRQKLAGLSGATKSGIAGIWQVASTLSSPKTTFYGITLDM